MGLPMTEVIEGAMLDLNGHTVTCDPRDRGPLERVTFGLIGGDGFSLLIQSSGSGTFSSAGATNGGAGLARYSIRYTLRAVPANIAAFSSADAFDAVSFSAFQIGAQPMPILSTGKLLS